MATNNQLNILILCADNKTANLRPPKLHNHIAYIVDNYFKNEIPVTQNIYYMGAVLDHDLENKKCKSETVDLITTCKYTHNMFDIILSEFCPLFVYTPIFFNNIKYLLNKNGVYSFIAPKDTNYYLPNMNITLDYTPEEFFNNIKQHSLIHIENYIAKHKTSVGVVATQTWSIIKKENAPAVIDDKLKTGEDIVELNTKHTDPAKKSTIGNLELSVENTHLLAEGLQLNVTDTTNSKNNINPLNKEQVSVDTGLKTEYNIPAKEQKFGNTKLRVANEITQQMQTKLINFISLGK